MGCDIHVCIEKRVDGVWQFVGSDAWDNNPDREHWDIWRDYDLFAILGGVRNGFGVAGIRTGSGFTPIAIGRGLPADRDPRTEPLGDHSDSWVTLRELIDFDWSQTTLHAGAETPKTYRECVRYWLDDYIPKLHAVGEPDDVRLVFNFDS